MNEESGFSVVEVMIVLLLLVLIGAGGWLVYKGNHKTTTTSHTANLYTGWRSFCSSYGGLCLRYPSDWTLSTKVEGVAPASNIAPQPTTKEANITSPSGNVTVEYQPYCIQLAAPPTGMYTDDVLSVTTPSGAPNFKVVKAISSYQGGTSNISESLYLTSGAVVRQNSITVGAHTDTTGTIDEAAAGFFKNTKSLEPNSLQCINVGSLRNSTRGNYLNFSSTAAVRAWFSTNDAQIATQILDSVSINQ